MKMTVKSIFSIVLVLAMLLSAAVSMTSCDLLEGLVGNNDDERDEETAVGIKKDDDDEDEDEENDEDYSKPKDTTGVDQEKKPINSNLAKTIAYKSENFEIDGAVVQYMYRENLSQLSLYSMLLSMDTAKSLSKQAVLETDKNIVYTIFGDDAYVDGTWFELLWDVTSKEAKYTLAICETALEDDFQLSDEKLAEIDSYVDGWLQSYGESYFEDTYGITSSDFKRASVLINTRDEYIEYMLNDILDGITDHQVNKYFEDNKDKYTSDEMYVKVKKFAHIIISQAADDESYPAEAEAKRILSEFFAGERTEEAFEKLMSEKTNYAEKAGNYIYIGSVVKPDGFTSISPEYSFDSSDEGSYTVGSFETAATTDITSPDDSYTIDYVGSIGSVGGFVTLTPVTPSGVSDNIEDTDGFYEVRPNMLKGELEEWLFDEERESGDLTIIRVDSTVIAKNNSNAIQIIKTVPGYDYHVMWYIGEGEELWYLDSKNDYANEILENWKEKASESISIKDVSAKSVKKAIAE